MYKKKAFTLIELLVVIAIISLLVSILLPSLRSAKELAENVVCMTNLKSIGVMMNYYTDANDCKMPYAASTVFIPSWDQQIFEASGESYDNINAFRNAGPSQLHCPSDKVGRGSTWKPRSYSYNPILCNLSGAYGASGATQAANDGIALKDVPRPDQVVSIFEWHASINWAGRPEYSCWNDCTWIHSDKANILFVDNHVESLAKEVCDVNGNTSTMFGYDYLHVN